MEFMRRKNINFFNLIYFCQKLERHARRYLFLSICPEVTSWRLRSTFPSYIQSISPKRHSLTLIDQSERKRKKKYKGSSINYVTVLKTVKDYV